MSNDIEYCISPTGSLEEYTAMLNKDVSAHQRRDISRLIAIASCNLRLAIPGVLNKATGGVMTVYGCCSDDGICKMSR